MHQNEILKKYFGYDSFRQGQDELVSSILSGRDTLGVMPTGAGKSLCYQIPALMLEGITIVISPLISLMQDQVGALVQSGIRAAYINSSLTMNQLYTVIRNAEAGVYKLIYVAPERLTSEVFLSFAKKAKISMITVDEAHCISQWGQDFRPSYLNIPQFAAELPQRPIMTAFTATATDRVREDISRLLCLNAPFTLVTGFDRKNLYFEVRRPSDKSADLKRLIADYDKEGRTGIVYCSTRKNVEDVCQRLCDSGFSATRYHAGLSEEERRANQEDFIYDRKRIMVATNAFGMGIDKSNVTYVIHYNMPKDVESYYQEAGRAGRDGSPSDCVLLYSGRDVVTAEFLINKSYEDSEQEPEIAEETRRRDLKRLRDMTFYCTCGDCLRGYILKYFGEKAPHECNSCSVCCSDSEETDVTVEAQKILSCIYRAEQKYGVKTICDILRGSSSEKLLNARLDKLSTYGIMKETSEKRIRRIEERLETMGYIRRTEGEYPVLKLDNSALSVLRGEKTVKARLPEETVRKKEQTVYSRDPKLMEILKAIRQKRASVMGVPAYFIFTDATLADMCEKRPVTNEQFLGVSGVGSAKLERYGNEFMNAIREYCEASPEQAPTVVKKAPNRLKTDADRKQAAEELKKGIAAFEPAQESMHITALVSGMITAAEANISAANLRTAVYDWLISENFLQIVTDDEGESRKGITERSGEIGIYEEEVTASSGKKYTRVLYSTQAQKYIADNIAAHL